MIDAHDNTAYICLRFAHWLTLCTLSIHLLMSPYSNFSLSSKHSEVICPERRKKTSFCHPTVFQCLTPNCYATPSSIFINLILPESRLRVLHFLPLIVCVYLLSNFRGGLRKCTIDVAQCVLTLQGHRRSMIFVSSERAYATSC